MTGKADFTSAEWSMILSSPMLAGMAVSIADPSGLWGMMQEAMASGRALLEAGSDPGASDLVKAVVADMETSEGRTAARDALRSELNGKTSAEIKQRAFTTLGEIGSVLDAKAPKDAAAFKGWLKHIAERVAEAGSEGGFMGFGGVKVSEAEKATIAEIATALKIA
ncbi:hypothetical protein [Methylocapsa aurea]|uniref:hypothetical protein n=1 Tax=Methylocapsa aurea TaxID=663610 RepID=UPI00055A5ADD|nr:hypothetical protein [Methylocapsa aurea]